MHRDSRRPRVSDMDFLPATTRRRAWLTSVTSTLAVGALVAPPSAAAHSVIHNSATANSAAQSCPTGLGDRVHPSSARPDCEC